MAFETLDPPTIANRALALFGGGQIQDFDDQNDVAQQCVRVYDLVVDECLASYDWNWAMATRKLDQLAAAFLPPNGYTYGYSFPVPAISGPYLLTRDAKRVAVVRDFKVEGRSIYTDADQLFGSFVLALSPDQWPAPFVALVVHAMASRLCIPITHDVDLADYFGALAWGTKQENNRGGLFQKAMAADLRTAPKRRPLGESDALTAAYLGN